MRHQKTISIIAGRETPPLDSATAELAAVSAPIANALLIRKESRRSFAQLKSASGTLGWTRRGEPIGYLLQARSKQFDLLLLLRNDRLEVFSLRCDSCLQDFL